jgi:hypothetical protein
MTAGLSAYLMTAGWSSDDYRFLGRLPFDAFWRRYASFTSFERPTALVCSKNGAFRAYVSGVLSARRDRTKTPLRYTLVLEGPCESAAASASLRVVQAFLTDLAAPSTAPQKVGVLGRALDTAFPETFVEAALTAMRDGESPAKGPLSEVEARLSKAILALSDSAPRVRSDLRFFWGGRASSAARAQFLGHAERLLAEGESGSALAVNLATRDHLESLGGAEASCAVLFSGEGGEDAFADPLEWPPKKGRPGSPKGRPRAIVRHREAQAEPGWSIPRWSQALWGMYRTVRGWLLGRPGSS